VCNKLLRGVCPIHTHITVILHVCVYNILFIFLNCRSVNFYGNVEWKGIISLPRCGYFTVTKNLIVQVTLCVLFIRVCAYVIIIT
jgi:hypothetical protein